MKRLTVVTTTYNSSRYLERYFEGVLDLDCLEQLQIILIMNMPDTLEKSLTRQYVTKYPDVFRVVELDHRETIAASLNRGFALADTLYISFLDVDDARVRDSFNRQMATLDDNPDVDYTYGDFVIVKSQGEQDGQYVSTSEFDRNEFTRGCHTSPTQLFRRGLLAKVGGLDEQLKSGGDFDFQIRAALNCQFEKTAGLMCYYTRYADSASASSNELQPIERTVIELRYGIFDKVDFRYVARAQQYRIGEILFDGAWHPVEKFVPRYHEWMTAREPLRAVGRRNFQRAQMRRRIESFIHSFKQILRGVLVHVGFFDHLLPIWRKWHPVERGE